MSNLTVIEQKTITFYGDEITGIKATSGNGPAVYSPIKELCENLGLDHSPQLRKIKSDKVLAKGMVIMTIPSEGGPQEVACLRHDLIPMWLTTINPGKVRPELREKIETYREQVAQILADVFLGPGYAVNPNRPDMQMLKLEIERLRLERQRDELNAKVRLVSEFKDLLGETYIRAIVTSITTGQVVPVEKVWSATDIAEMIRQNYGIMVHPNTIGRVITDLGLRPGPEVKETDLCIRSITPAKNGKPVEQLLWKRPAVNRIVSGFLARHAEAAAGH